MTGRFGYTGQAWLPETRLYYYKARLYAPKLGRFLQTDPVGSQAGLNLYDYADSDPINLSDPDGLTPIYGPVLPTLGGGNYDSPWSDLSSTITVTASYGRQTVGVGVPSFNATASARPAWMIAGPARGSVGLMQVKSQDNNQCPAVPNPGLGQAELNGRANASAARAALRNRDFFSIPSVDNRIELLWKSVPGARNDTKSYVRGSAEYGNFLFGAEAAAGGISLQEALNWGANAQVVQDVLKGQIPTGSDNPGDAYAVSRGYRYYQVGCTRQ